MNKVGVGVGAAVVIVGGLLGASWYVGNRVEQQINDDLAVINQTPFLKATLVSFDKGLFSSSANVDLKLTIGDEVTVFKSAQQIKQGLLAFGPAATMTSVITLDKNASNSQWAKILSAHPPVEAHTKVSWLGTASNTMQTPAFAVEHEEGKFSWSGINAKWDSTSKPQWGKGTVELPNMQITAKNGSVMDFQRMNMRFDLSKANEKQLYWLGDYNVGIDTAVFTPGQSEDTDEEPSASAGEGKKSPVKMQNLVFEYGAHAKNGAVDIPFKLLIKSLQSSEFNAEDLTLDLAINNLDEQWLNEYTLMQTKFAENLTLAAQKAKAEQADTTAATVKDSEHDADESEDSEEDSTLTAAEDAAFNAMRDDFLGSLPQFLASKPELVIKRLSMRTTEGVADVSAQLAYAGEGDLKKGNPLLDLKASVKAALPRAMLEKLFGDRAKKQYLAYAEMSDQKVKPAELDEAIKSAVNEQLQGMVENGVFVEQSGQWSSSMVFEKGELKLNDKRIDLMGALSALGGLGD